MINLQKTVFRFLIGIGSILLIAGFCFTSCEDGNGDGKETKPSPVAGDYTIGNLNQTAGSVSAVTITVNNGKSPGTVSNIRYNGSTTIPQATGTYPVTFDVAAATGWNAAIGLSAGNLVVGNRIPVASDYTIGNLNQVAGSVTAVTITVNSGKSPGTVSNIRYNGSTTIPQTTGTFPVTFDVAAATGWDAAAGLSAGTLTIRIPTVSFISNGGSMVAPITNIALGSTISKPDDPVKSVGMATIFDGWYDYDLINAFDFDTAITTDITLYAKWEFPIKLGDTGPGGGRVFYRSDMGFSMTDTNTTVHYLEAAPADIPPVPPRTGHRWWGTDGFMNQSIPGTSTLIGTGRNNINVILAADSEAPAALVCKQYTNNGISDWFLPSFDELEQLYINRAFVNNPGTGTYWSSTQNNSGFALNFRFDGQPQAQGGGSKSNYHLVRAIRSF